jgi:hypothetical protein
MRKYSAGKLSLGLNTNIQLKSGSIVPNFTNPQEAKIFAVNTVISCLNVINFYRGSR